MLTTYNVVNSLRGSGGALEAGRPNGNSFTGAYYSKAIRGPMNLPKRRSAT